MMKPEDDKDKSKAVPAKKTDNKVFDVRRPGKALASPTSKPVILGHKASAQQAQAAVSGVGETRPLLTKRKIEILPSGNIEVKTADAAAPTPKTPSKVPVSVPSEEEAAPAKPTQEETDALATAALDAVTGPPELSEPEPESDKKPEVSVIGRKIEPLTPSKDEEAPAPEAEPPAPAEPEAAAEPAPEPEPETKPKAEPASEAPEEAESKPKSEQPEEPVSKPEPEIAEKELPAESSSMPEAEPIEKSDEEKEETPPEPEIEPLFDDSGAIIVSNHDHHRSYHGLKVFFLLLLIIILAIAALDIVLDLGLLTLDGIPHTDLLQN